MRRSLFALLAVLWCAPCIAQVSPTSPLQPCHFVSVYGYVGTAGQWANCINSLQLALPYTPVNLAGDQMQGALGVTQLYGAGAHPTVAAGTGAGTSPTVSLEQTPHDFAFQLKVITGTAPAGTNAVIVTVTFASNYNQIPTCTFSPRENNAASLAAAAQPFGVGAVGPPSTWALTSGATALAATTTYKWSVICGG